MQHIQFREPHILKKKRGTRHPRNFLFFDTETKATPQTKGSKSEEHRLWFGIAWGFHYSQKNLTRSTFSRFTTPKQFWGFVRKRLNPRMPLYLFAHNTPFDLTITNFWQLADDLGMKVSYTVAQGNLVFLDLIWDDCKLTILDTFNYWKCSVEDMGKSLGIKKLSMPKLSASQEKWDEYCKRDVLIIGNQIVKFLDFLTDEQLGSFGISAASTAMGCFRQRFMKHEIYLHDRVRVLQLERESYHGGLVLNYFVGASDRKTLYHTDINSLYPAVMRGMYPVKLIDDWKDVAPHKLGEVLRGCGGVARVRINSSTTPYLKVIENRLCEVTGSFDTTLCASELYEAYKLGHIVHVHHVAFYELAPIFVDYVEYFWKKRQQAQAQGDKVQNGLYKLLLNTLYGKFGQRGHHWVDWSPAAIDYLYKCFGLQCPDKYLDKNYQPLTGNYVSDAMLEGLPIPVKLRYIAGRLSVWVPTGEHAESFCAISAFVTSYGRSYLRKMIRTAGDKQVYYCDTDSLFTTKVGYDRLVAAGYVKPSELGMLKLEGKSNKWAFYGPKDYEFGDKVVIKGIRKKHKRITDTLFEQTQFEGIAGVLRRGAAPYIEIKTVRKQLSRELTKGIKLHSGWVVPFTIIEQL